MGADTPGVIVGFDHYLQAWLFARQNLLDMKVIRLKDGLRQCWGLQ